jgi:hypothetical protein
MHGNGKAATFATPHAICSSNGCDFKAKRCTACLHGASCSHCARALLSAIGGNRSGAKHAAAFIKRTGENATLLADLRALDTPHGTSSRTESALEGGAQGGAQGVDTARGAAAESDTSAEADSEAVSSDFVKIVADVTSRLDALDQESQALCHTLCERLAASSNAETRCEDDRRRAALGGQYREVYDAIMALLRTGCICLNCITAMKADEPPPALPRCLSKRQTFATRAVDALWRRIERTHTLWALARRALCDARPWLANTPAVLSCEAARYAASGALRTKEVAARICDRVNTVAGSGCAQIALQPGAESSALQRSFPPGTTIVKLIPPTRTSGTDAAAAFAAAFVTGPIGEISGVRSLGGIALVCVPRLPSYARRTPSGTGYTTKDFDAEGAFGDVDVATMSIQGVFALEPMRRVDAILVVSVGAADDTARIPPLDCVVATFRELAIAPQGVATTATAANADVSSNVASMKAVLAKGPRRGEYGAASPDTGLPALSVLPRGGGAGGMVRAGTPAMLRVRNCGMGATSTSAATAGNQHHSATLLATAAPGPHARLPTKIVAAYVPGGKKRCVRCIPCALSFVHALTHAH